MKRWTKAIKRTSTSNNSNATRPDTESGHEAKILTGPRLGARTVSKKQQKSLRKQSKDLNISIVSMADDEVQIPNIYSWTKSYIPNSKYKTV